MPVHHKTISSLPFRVYYQTIFTIALGGLVVSFYLAASHYRVFTDMGYRSFCALTRSINCDTVSQSPYSILWSLPVPFWGFFGYAFLLLVLILASGKNARPTRFWPVILIVTMIYSLMSFFFAYLSTFHIRSYCILCIATYAVNLLTLFYAWLIRRRFDPDSFFVALKKDLVFVAGEGKKKAVLLIIPLVTTAVLTWMLVPLYWQIPAPSLSADIPTGQTIDGHPWIGARQPVLTITEFSDYQCFQCRKMHLFLRTLIRENPDKIQLIHRHFPMDHKFNPILKEPFHVGSGEMALLSIFAITQDNFWPVNDYLYEVASLKRDFNTKEIAESLGMDVAGIARGLRDYHTLEKLRVDIAEGLKLGVTGTPSFFINGNLYHASIPSDIIRKALENK